MTRFDSGPAIEMANSLRGSSGISSMAATPPMGSRVMPLHLDAVVLSDPRMGQLVYHHEGEEQHDEQHSIEGSPAVRPAPPALPRRTRSRPR